MRDYNIAFKGLTNGTHSFTYAIDKSFFSQIEDSLIEDGELTAEVVMTKSEQMLKLKFYISGTVKTICDICLGEVNYFIDDCEEDIIVKFGETTEEIDETLFQLAHEENEISVAQWIYEFICTSLPVRITHEDGECDQNMLKELQHYLVSDVNIRESDDKQESNSEDDNDEPIDPRWAALKGLRDKNN